MAATPLRILVIDDNTDSRMLLVKSLLRKFPAALVQGCQDGDTAIAIAATDTLDAIVAHRTYDYDGATLVGLIRRTRPDVPLIMVSGHDHGPKAREVGADAFLHSDEWLRIGSVVADVMAARAKAPTSIEAVHGCR
jgi:DNA-binding response OmpR family regulator